MKNKSNLFLAHVVSGASKNIRYPLDPDPEKIHPGTGSRIQGVKNTESRIQIRNTDRRDDSFASSAE
jgi:hypothetical protein